MPITEFAPRPVANRKGDHRRTRTFQFAPVPTTSDPGKPVLLSRGVVLKGRISAGVVMM